MLPCSRRSGASWSRLLLVGIMYTGQCRDQRCVDRCAQEWRYILQRGRWLRSTWRSTASRASHAVSSTPAVDGSPWQSLALLSPPTGCWAAARLARPRPHPAATPVRRRGRLRVVSGKGGKHVSLPPVHAAAAAAATAAAAAAAAAAGPP